MIDKMSLSDRMKLYEKLYCGDRFMPLLPIIARLDGRAFHSWTNGLKKPFDTDFMDIMSATTRKLVEDTNAVVGYTQSDEITLVFYSDDIKSQVFFDGKIFKMTSVLASMCTGYFRVSLDDKLGCVMKENFEKAGLLVDKPPAIFDCRVFQVPSLEEACNCLIWREQDAVRNSIQAVGQANFSKKQLYKKSCDCIQEMLFSEKDINWNNFSPHEKRGVYFRRVKVERKFSCEEIEKLPPKHEARSNPDLVIERSDVLELIDIPILTKVKNRVDVIFHGKDPVLNS